MLNVLPPAAAHELIHGEFGGIRTASHRVRLDAALGCVLARDILAKEYVPGFDRSTVDGFAVRASDTFGCSESIPAMLAYKGEVLMGQTPDGGIGPGECMYVPTGGELPEGADAVVMIEYAEDYGDGLRYIMKPSTPGQHVVYRGDDVVPGKTVLHAGKRLEPQDIGSLAALGYPEAEVRLPVRVGVISTGDELVDISTQPSGAQIRDVNTHALCAGVRAAGGEPMPFRIVRDDYGVLLSAAKHALDACDMLLISGGSSVGTKDATHRVIDALGKPGVLMHGVAMKPGKPTILGSADGKPVFGLPGHPVAAYFIFHIFVRPLICSMLGTTVIEHAIAARLTANISSNHGREEFLPVAVTETDGEAAATPLIGKSGLITVLSQAAGYVRIGRDCEGIARGETVRVHLF
ncbi:MAG: gephyrin-like molybdotransferase Glp [Bacillota bacterium]